MPIEEINPKKCYMHSVQDPNEEHYDPEKHALCGVCVVKLWELANAKVEIEMRDSIVKLSLREL